MKLLLPVLSILFASCRAVPYGQPKRTKTELKCKPYYEKVYEDKCQQYTDRVCTTQHREDCYDVPGESCKAILASKQVRKCFNVTELLCTLKEDVQYDIVQASSTVQNCRKINERVCDTVYRNEFTSKDNYKCLPLTKIECNTEDQVIQDKTCKTTTEFDCKEKYSAKGYGTDYGYDAPEVVCKRNVNTNCYNTPRTITVEKCELKKEKKCEKFAEKMPFPVEKQHCHDEKKRVCELEMKKQPKQIKKYVYSEQCRPIHRTICENADVKNLVQSCAPFNHKTCKYTPEEKCVDIPKEHCYKVPKSVRKQKCRTVTVEDEEPYSSESSGSSSDSSRSDSSSFDQASFASAPSSSFSSAPSSSFSSAPSSSFSSPPSSSFSSPPSSSFSSPPSSSFSSAPTSSFPTGSAKPKPSGSSLFPSQASQSFSRSSGTSPTVAPGANFGSASGRFTAKSNGQGRVIY